eukprot:430245-Rhodomonas_salina.1
MLSATPGPGSSPSSDDEPRSETTSDSSLPSSNDSPSSKLTLVEAFSDSAIAQHLYLFSAPSTENLLQTQLCNTREWIAHNLDPPILERADAVPLQSRTADITNALSLHNSLDCPYVTWIQILNGHGRSLASTSNKRRTEIHLNQRTAVRSTVRRGSRWTDNCGSLLFHRTPSSVRWWMNGRTLSGLK